MVEDVEAGLAEVSGDVVDPSERLGILAIL